MEESNQIEGLLLDLKTITNISQAGIISSREERLKPGETRLVAILFLDVVGFTRLGKKLSAEQLTLLIDRTFRIFELTIKAHGGYLDKVIGDAGLYVFAGHPNYPPVCEAALRAALKLRERLRQINESLSETKLSIEIRIGVNFGEVSRQKVGGEDVQITVIGDTVNMAQRLESTARPGQIQTTRTVLDEAGDIFLVKELDMLGCIGSEQIFEVNGIEEQPAQLRGAFRKLTPMVGRAEELARGAAQIEDWWGVAYGPETWDIVQLEQPLIGRNRLLIVRGVPAVGKSRLAHELISDLAARRDFAYGAAHCSENMNNASLLAEMAAVAGVDAGNLPDRWNELCEHAAQVVNPDYANRQRQHLSLLAYVLGCKEVNTKGIEQADAKAFELSCNLALRACIELAAHFSERPVVIIVEDLQWLGEGASMLANVMQQACLPQPLVLVATARPEYSHTAGNLGEGESHIIELAPLSSSCGKEILDYLLPGLDLPEPLESELYEKACGLPYYYEEFARMLLRRGLVLEAEAGYELAARVTSLDLPENIQVMILGRLDQLEPELKELARRASVLGSYFQSQLIEELERRLGFMATDHPRRPLGQLVSQHVLGQEPGDVYFYEHLLLHDAAYSTLLQQNRRVLHGVAADVLTELYPQGCAGERQVLPRLVNHLVDCERWTSAHETTCRLLELLVAAGNYHEWEHWQSLAEHTWEKVRSSDAGLPEQSPGLRLVLAVKNWAKWEIDEARQHLEAVLLHWRETGKRDREALTLIRLAGLLVMEMRMDESLQAYQEALDLCQQEGDTTNSITCLYCMGNACFTAERYAEARTYTEKAMLLNENGGNLRLQALGLETLSLLSMIDGEFLAAKQQINVALSIMQKLGDWVMGGHYMLLLGALCLEFGELNEAETQIASAIAKAKEIGDPLLACSALGYLGRLHAVRGELDKARSALVQCESALDKTQAPLQPLTSCHWAYYHLSRAKLAPAEDADGISAALADAHESLSKAGTAEASTFTALGLPIKRELSKLEQAIDELGC